MKQYDIFISYKRKSEAVANNLYYRLTIRGYSTFYDQEEMNRGNYDDQLFSYIENAKDVFVLLEKGSLEACLRRENEPDSSFLNRWKSDWFCREIAHAIQTKRNIIPVLIDGYEMPDASLFPKELEELSLQNSMEFSLFYFDNYLNKLIEKEYITSKAQQKNQATSIFKFYSDIDCIVYKDGKQVLNVVGMSDEPYYLPVSRKGDYRFNCVFNNGKKETINSSIDNNEEKIIHIGAGKKWEKGKYMPYVIIVCISIVLNISILSYYIVSKESVKSESVKLESVVIKNQNKKSTLTEIYNINELVQTSIEQDKH